MIKARLSYLSSLFLLALLLFGLNGCGIWNDFTTYFNLYYNTSTLFNEAETAIKNSEKDVFALTEANVPGIAASPLNKVIEKCSKILQFNAESDFVDDALFMLGKSFYYQKNYLKAMRKFQELIAKQPDSKYVPETELWIAKTYLQLKNYPSAEKILTEVMQKAIADKDEDLQVKASIIEIKYEISQKRYSDAVKSLRRLTTVSDDGELNAQAKYQEGELLMQLDQKEEAAKAFASVSDYSPSFEIELDAKINYAKIIRSLGKTDEALEQFLNLLSKDKNSTSFDVLNFETGYTFLVMNKYDDALSFFGIVDTGYSNSTTAGQARFEMGYIYEKIKNDYDSAAIFYTKAKTGASTQEYASLIKNKAETFTKYQKISGEYIDNLVKLKYATDTTAFLRDSVAYVIADSIAKAEALENQGPIPTLQDVQQGRTRNFSNVKNTNQQKDEKKKTVQLRMPVRPTISADSITTLLVKNKFELGNIFYTDLDRPDSAFFYYNDLVEHYDLKEKKPQVLYALATYYLPRDSVKADSLLNYIYDNYQHESIVNAAAEILGKPKVDFQFDPAKGLYRDAELSMQHDSVKTSLKKFLSISKNYPSSEYAAKSLLAGGYLLEEKLILADSAASVYDSLVTKYPKSAYAQSVAPKLTAYKQEKARIKAALEDSLKKIEAEKLKKKTEDSLKIVAENLKKKTEDSLKIAAENLKKKTDDSLKVEPAKHPEVPKSDSVKVPEAPKKETPALPDSLKNEEGKDPPETSFIMQRNFKDEKILERLNQGDSVLRLFRSRRYS